MLSSWGGKAAGIGHPLVKYHEYKSTLLIFQENKLLDINVHFFTILSFQDWISYPIKNVIVL